MMSAPLLVPDQDCPDIVYTLDKDAARYKIILIIVNFPNSWWRMDE
jgi:hypothetical protein